MKKRLITGAIMLSILLPLVIIDSEISKILYLCLAIFMSFVGSYEYVSKAFKDRPEMWRKLYDMCYDKLKQKDDPYIIAFEQMMQVNINEKLGIDGDTNMEEI